MIDLIMRRRVPDGNAPNNIALNGVPVTDETASVGRDVYMVFTDDPTMEPVHLGFQAADRSLAVPIDLQGREIMLTSVSRTSDGKTAARLNAEAVQTTFSQPEPPTLESVEYIGDADVELFFAHNGGGGDINIFRSVDDAEFAQIATADFDDTQYIDTTADLDGEYAYYLTQDGITGQSNTREDAVSGESGGTGSPPTLLSGVWDDPAVDLDWTNNSGTGLNHIERKMNPGGVWVEIDTVSSGTAVYADSSLTVRPLNRTYYYRVRNASVVGYSNEAAVYVPAE